MLSPTDRWLTDVAGRVVLLHGFNLVNKPFTGSTSIRCLRPGGSRAFDRRLSAFSRRVAEAIREVDPDRLVFYEPNVLFDYGADTHLEPLGTKTGFSFHVYCLAASPGVPAFARGRLQDLACAGQEQRVFNLAEQHCRKAGAAPLLTEFGATDDLRSVARVAELADRNLVSWQYWAYFNRDPCCGRPEEKLVHDFSRPPTPDNVKQDKLRVLGRAFPRAVAGTPERLRFDPASGAFEFEYSTRPPEGRVLADELETEVFCPASAIRTATRSTSGVDRQSRKSRPSCFAWPPIAVPSG